MPKKITLYNKKPIASMGGRQHVVKVVAWAVGAALLFCGLLFGFGAYTHDRVPYGARIGDLQLGGLDFSSAKKVIEQAVATEVDKGLTVRYQGQDYAIPSTIDDQTNPDLASPPLYTYDIDQTMAQLAVLSGQFNELERVYYWVRGWRITPVLTVDRIKLESLLRGELGGFESPAENARLVVSSADDISIQPETSGLAFRYDIIIEQLVRRLSGVSVAPVVVDLERDTPAITESMGASLLSLARQIMQSAPYNVTYGDKSWPLVQDQVRSWLEFQSQDGRTTVGLNPEKLTEYLTSIAGEVNVPVSEGKFAMADGKVTSFAPSRDGLEVQMVDSVRQINDKIHQVGIKDIDLVVMVTKPHVDMASVNDMGINDLIGEGHSNFKGSPANRRHNIKTGADKLNGILIKPDEEFSLVKTLGAVDASTGYLTELVIKGNKTVPEYGGGLCQIGTTTFRAALDAGLPILERSNHSYRVSYYEPAGTDATIYDPKPDFRFKNDTGHYILFTTDINGDDLYFRFYGTSDARKVEQTMPRIYNLKSPAPKKIVETTDLAPGQTKCTEKAHVGADVEFTRTITYADGTQKVDTFKSHYKPWQEVCLVGVVKAAPAPTSVPDTNTNTSAPANTNAVTPTNTNTATNTEPMTNDTNKATNSPADTTNVNIEPPADAGV